MPEESDLAARDWSTFLRIPEPGTSDLAPALDPGWCAASGVNPGAEVVLRLLRDEVSPLLYELLLNRGLSRYHFLVHDRLSGVPTTEKDHSAYIHLRLWFRDPIVLELSAFPKFEMTRSVTGETSAIAGIDLALLTSKSVAIAVEIIELQSQWVIRLISEHTWKDDAEMVRQVRQFLHYFGNMLQMRVG